MVNAVARPFAQALAAGIRRAGGQRHSPLLIIWGTYANGGASIITHYPETFRVNGSHSASSRKPRRRRGLGIGAEILFCLKKDWNGKPAPSGKPPNNE